jgi:hypothetical protein
MNKLTVFVLLLLTVLMGCNKSTPASEPSASIPETTDAPTVKEKRAGAQFVGKPGAPVSLKNQQPYFVDAPGVVDLALLLTTAKDSGVMQVDIAAGAGVELHSSQLHYEFALTQDGTYELPLQVAIAAEGRYYINLQVSVLNGDERENRVITAIVQVGAPAAHSNKPRLAPATITDDEAGVIELPAQETQEPASE